eukprot:Selendium_serpulae@DN6475_c0_g2_i1.p1
MSVNGSLLRVSRARHFVNAPLQSFPGDANNTARCPPPGQAPRPYLGLDMRKVNDYPWINTWQTRVPRDYQYNIQSYEQPSVYALNPEETASFFHNNEYWRYFTWRQMLQATAKRQYRYAHILMFATALGLPVWVVTMLVHQYEPREDAIAFDDFWENAQWHYWGRRIDPKAFAQYLEARRAKKYRDVDVNPVDYIPTEFRSPQQIDEFGKGKAVGVKPLL